MMNENVFIKSLLRLSNLYIYLTCLLLINGCNEDNKAMPQTINDSSTSLLDNPNNELRDIDSFKNNIISIDPNDFEINGGRLFLKLFHEDGRVLYLGEINPTKVFSISLSTLVSDELIHYEIFTDHATDIPVSGVILI